MWRVEFSMKSKARNWIVIEFQGGKKVKKQRLPHTLDMFDSKEKLWQRFEELAYHYFRFKYKEYKNADKFILQPKSLKTDSAVTLELRRKYDCADKPLFNFNMAREFHQLDQLPKEVKKSRDDEILRRRIIHYKLHHLDPQIQIACQTLLDNLTRDEWRKLAEANSHQEIIILQRALSMKLNHDERDVCEIIAELRTLIDENSFF